MTKDLLCYDIELKNILVVKCPSRVNMVLNYINRGRKRHLLHYVLSGIREFTINGKTFTVGKGGVIFIPDKTEYTTRAIECDEEYWGIGIAFYVDGIPENLLKKDVYYKYADVRYEGENAFVAIEKAFTQVPTPHLKIKTLLHHLLLSLADDNAVSPLQPAMDFIYAHYNENLPVKIYADTCNISESHFRKLFHQYTGVSPIEFRNLVRFAKAKVLLEQGLTLNEIADQTGFCDANYFSKLYKRYMQALDKDFSKFI